GNGHENAVAPRTDATEAPDKTGVSIGALIAEAQALRDAARDLYGRAGRLLTALQRHRRQSRLVASTLQSLRQLQQIGGGLGPGDGARPSREPGRPLQPRFVLEGTIPMPLKLHVRGSRKVTDNNH